MANSKELKWLQSTVHLAKTFSTCSKRQYFAVILASNGRVVSVGYNGSPPGMPHCTDGFCPRFHENSPNGSSYDNCIAQHAETNAIVWADVNLRMGSTLIVNGPPCFNCAKTIASSGIIKVVFIPDESYAQWATIKDFFTDAGISLDPVTLGGLYEPHDS